MFDSMHLYVVFGVNIEIYASSYLSFWSNPNDLDGSDDCCSNLYLYRIAMRIKWVLLKQIFYFLTNVLIIKFSLFNLK